MVYEFKFPDVGEGIHEGTIVKWLVKEGEKVNADQPLGEIETDKAIVEMPSPKTGRILKLHVAAGGIIHVGEDMVTILEEHETESDAKKQLNVSLEAVKGTGQGGRITIEDVQKVSGGAPKQAAAGESPGFKKVRKYDFFGYVDREQLKGVRKVAAAKMTESIFTAAQLTNMHEADVTELWALREKEKAAYEKEGIKLTLMPYVVKAVSCSLMNNPYLNASLEGEEIVFKKYYNIGVAVDSEEGLFVPVVKGAQAKDMKTIARDIQRLADDAQTRKVNMIDLKGGTFTISNLGSVGVQFFTPIINYPESAILGVGRMAEKPVARNGKVEIRKILPLSVTYDHRIVDGAQAARFALELIRRLETMDFSVPEVKEGH